MTKFIVSFLLYFLIYNWANAIESRYISNKVLRIHPETFEQVKELKNLESSVDFWDSVHLNTTNGIRVMVSFDQLQIVETFLETRHIRYNILIENVSKYLKNKLNINFF